MSEYTEGRATAILNDEVLLARRDKNAFDCGFQCGLQCVQENHAETLEALKELVREEFRDDGDPILERARIRARNAITANSIWS